LAAVLHGHWNRQLYTFEPQRTLPTIFSTYTFGMPRYGNKAALEYFEGTAVQNDHPYHILNPWDFVTGILPRQLDYSDSEHEYSCIANETKRTRTQWSKKGFPVRIGSHFIKNYISNLAKRP